MWCLLEYGHPVSPSETYITGRDLEVIGRTAKTMLYACWSNCICFARGMRCIKLQPAFPLHRLVHTALCGTSMAHLHGDQSVVGEHTRDLIHCQVDHVRIHAEAADAFFSGPLLYYI